MRIKKHSMLSLRSVCVLLVLFAVVMPNMMPLANAALPCTIQGHVNYNGVHVSGATVTATWLEEGSNLSSSDATWFDGTNVRMYGLDCIADVDVTVVATYNGISSAPVVVHTPVGGGLYTIGDINIVGPVIAPPVADFSATPTSGAVPLTVVFTDASLNAPTGWQWNFGDGTANATVQNPSHQYASAGTYTVTLTATNAYGSGAVQKTSYVTVYAVPVAGFTAGVTNGNKPLAVTFNSGSSTGVITAYAWDFDNNGAVDSTDANPTWTYYTAGTYTVKLTVTGPGGSNSMARTNYITVGDGLTPDLTVTGMTVNNGGSSSGYNFLFANESNTVNVTVKNVGNGTAGPSTLSVNVAGNVYTASVGTLAPDAVQYVVITDTVLRNGGASVAITATADSAGVIPEISELNNALTTSWTVYNSGYKGKRYTGGSDFNTKLSLTGRNNVIYSFGNSAYSGANWAGKTVAWTAGNLAIPAGDTVVSARLYQAYTYNQMSADPAFTVSFNGNTVTPIATFKDRKGFGSYDYPQGLYVYDVTGQFNTAGNSMTITPEVGNNYAIYGTYLVVVYADPLASVKTIYINDECDILAAYNTYTVSSEEATAYANFAGVDASNLKSAKAIAILASAGDSDKSKFFFNGNEYTGFWANYQSGPQEGISEYDVTGSLTSGANTARMQSFLVGTTGDSMYAQNVILVVEKNEAVPVANFDPLSWTGTSPLTINFADLSTGASTYLWDFGDGTTSTLPSPSHTFTSSTPQTYTVTLTVANSAGNSTKTGTVSIVTSSVLRVSPAYKEVQQDGTTTFDLVVDRLPGGISGYSLYVTLGSPGKALVSDVSFPDWATYSDVTTLPSGVVRIRAMDTNNVITEPWNTDLVLATVTLHGIANGTTSVDVVNVTMEPDIDSYRDAYDPIIVNGSLVVYTPLIANFAADDTDGNAPFLVNFNDLTFGYAATWSWNFGDGSTATLQNPSHTYTVPGLYTVSLNVTNQFTSDVETKTNYVLVRNTTPVAGFSATPTAGISPVTVAFTDASTGVVDSYFWDFGDGSNSTLKNPVHTYVTSTPRNYTVSLTVTNNGGSNTMTKTEYIKVTTVLPDVKFSASPDAGYVSLTVQFTDLTTGPGITGYQWSFGDGTPNSTDKNPSHTYASTGTKTVILTVTNGAGSSSKTGTITVYARPHVSVDITAPQETGINNTKTINIVANVLPRGLSGFDLSVSLANASVAEIVGVSYPSWATFKNTSGMPGDTVRIGALDIGTKIEDGATNVVLATLTLRGDVNGTTPIALSNVVMDDDDGRVIAPTTAGANFGVYTVVDARFTSDKVTGYAPVRINFTDTSLGYPDHWAWDFGDGNMSSLQNPSHEFGIGVWTVKLTAWNSHMSDTEIKTNYIDVVVWPHISVLPNNQSTMTGTTRTYDIIVDILPKGLAGYMMNVSLANGTVGEIVGVSYPSWAGLNSTVPANGDMLKISAADLYHLVEAGATNVKLATITVRGDVAGESLILMDCAIVDDDEGLVVPTYLAGSKIVVYEPLDANFMADPLRDALNNTHQLTVGFSDLTTGTPGPTAWAWDFDGDGIVDSSLQNPVFIYTHTGNYTVTLTASNMFTGDTETKTCYIRVKPYVESFPGKSGYLPLDPEDNDMYWDINGNGRLDFDDVVTYYQNMDWMRGNTNVGITWYDFNTNGRIDFDDVVVLFHYILG